MMKVLVNGKPFCIVLGTALLMGWAKSAEAVEPTLCTQSSSIVVPQSRTNSEGNSRNHFPFNIGLSGWPNQRYQQVFSSSEFPTGPINITGIAFRSDGGSGSQGFQATLPDVQIDLSTTAKTVDGLDNNFTNNVGADNVIVYERAPLALSSHLGRSYDFDVVIDSFLTPFLYDPSSGNLLLDVRNYGGGGSDVAFFDAENAGYDSISRVYTTSIGDVTSDAKSSANTAGLVTQFIYC